MSVIPTKPQPPKFIQTGIPGFFAHDDKPREPFVPIDVSREPRTILGKRRGRPRKYDQPQKQPKGLTIASERHKIEEVIATEKENINEEGEEQEEQVEEAKRGAKRGVYDTVLQGKFVQDTFSNLFGINIERPRPQSCN